MKNNFEKLTRILLISFAVIGISIMSYLIYLHYSPDTGGSFCDLGEGLSCDIVNKSEYSEIFGIPVSGLGLLYFLAVLYLSLMKFSKKYLRILIAGTIVLLGPSLYLTYIEINVINNICVLCEASKALMIGIALIAIVNVGYKNIGNTVLISSIVGAIILATFFQLAISSKGPGKSYVTFAQCLYDKGFRMYGSKGCSFCAQQRALFGEAIEEIKEIECDPRFPNAQYELCIEKNILHTPTWIFEDENGKDLMRFDPGVIKLDKLSEVSECPLLIDKEL